MFAVAASLPEAVMGLCGLGVFGEMKGTLILRGRGITSHTSRYFS